jgi:hypothetical protein
MDADGLHTELKRSRGDNSEVEFVWVRVTVVHRTGWHEIEGENVFVLPGENIGRKSVGRVLLDGEAHGPYETKGTLADWREGIAALASGHATPMLAISGQFGHILASKKFLLGYMLLSGSRAC